MPREIPPQNNDSVFDSAFEALTSLHVDAVSPVRDDDVVSIQYNPGQNNLRTMYEEFSTVTSTPPRGRTYVPLTTTTTSERTSEISPRELSQLSLRDLIEMRNQSSIRRRISLTLRAIEEEIRRRELIGQRSVDIYTEEIDRLARQPYYMRPSSFYILNENDKPVLESQSRAYRWAGMNPTRVNIGLSVVQGITVNTKFMLCTETETNNNFYGTFIGENEARKPFEFYSTREEAIKGHRRAIASINL